VKFNCKLFKSSEGIFSKILIIHSFRAIQASGLEYKFKIIQTLFVKLSDQFKGTNFRKEFN